VRVDADHCDSWLSVIEDRGACISVNTCAVVYDEDVDFLHHIHIIANSKHSH
jgi:hypothetical protein